MSTHFEFNGTGTEDVRDRKRERLLAWSEQVFSEPSSEGGGLNPRLYELGYISHEQEQVLYKDLNSRDSEVGLGLLDWRKADLSDSVSYLKSSIKKREHAAALVRSRLEALERFASGSPSEEQRATQTELAGELDHMEMELIYLRAYSSKLDALERIIKLVGNESNIRVTRTSEQILRLFSQSWRGLVKIKAWHLHFEETAHLPMLQPYKQPGELAGYLLPLGEGMRAVAISKDTAGYLLHLMDGINSLAEKYCAELLAGRNVVDGDWTISHKLIRSIVELFYFCNFEMPFSYVDLAIDPEDPSQLCVYNYQSGEWEMVNEDANSSRTLKRVGAEAAQLLINGGSLLKCRRDDDLAVIIENEAPQLTSPGEAHNYRLFMCSGLSEFDLDPASQRVKFRMAFSSMSQLLQAITEGQTSLKLVSRSNLGGPLETLLGMAMLNIQAFSLPEGTQGPDALGRYQTLSHFWRALGKRRAIAMLGEDYVKQVTNGLASLGEKAPDHPTFLTMRAGTVFGVGAGNSKEAQAQAAPNPFTTLGLSDQIRILDLAIQTWRIAEELLEKLRDVHSQGKLKRILELVPVIVSQRKEDIQLRFNNRWLTANNWQWTFMRTCTPVAWDFWCKLSSNEDWDTMLLSIPPYQALGLLLRLFSDVVRLILVMELSGAEVAQSIQIESESAGQAIMIGLEGFFREGERLPPQVAESINFYYDPEVRFDSWLAFTSSFCRYLDQMGKDLKVLNVDEKLLRSINGLIEQIEILYPVRESMLAMPALIEPIEDVSLENMVIDESQAQTVEYILNSLLEVSEKDNWTFFKLLSFSMRSDKRHMLDLTMRHSAIIANLLPDEHMRSLIFNMPSTAKNFFNFLASIDEQGNPPAEQLNEMRPQMNDYFGQLAEHYQHIIPLTNQLPNLLPDDQRRLNSYLLSPPQKSPGIDFLVLLACNRLILDINDGEIAANLQFERAETKIRAYMREHLNVAVEDPSLEIYPIGSGRIIARRNQIILTSTPDGYEPFWSDITQPRSQSLYQRFVAKKFAIVAQLLMQEFPALKVLVG